MSAESDATEQFTAANIFKTPEQQMRILEKLSTNFLFQGLEPAQQRDVIANMTEKIVSPGDYVIREGENGDSLFLIERGEFDVLKKIKGVETKVFKYNNSGAFGELALMYNCPRAASVQATTEGCLWALDRLAFKHLVVGAKQEKSKMYESFLESVPLLSKLTTSERAMIADCLVSETFEDGDVVLNQGDTEEMPKLYLIEEGEAQASQQKGDTDVVVGHMKRGDYFGERALITSEPRAATVRAVGSLKTAAMDRASFERLLGDCREIMARQIEAYTKAK